MTTEARILVVDDSVAVRLKVAITLRRAGFFVVEAADGVSAAQAVLAQRFDAIVTDQSMPAMSGLHLCRLLQSDPRTASLPVVLLTASTGREVSFWAARCGAAGVVAKDDLDELVPMLRSILAFADERPEFPLTTMTRESVQARIAELLERDLSDAILAGEVRKVGQQLRDGAIGDLGALSASLAGLVTQLLSARWFWLSTSEHTYVFCADGAEAEARAHLEAVVGCPRGEVVTVAVDGRFDGDGIAMESHPIAFGGEEIGLIGVGAARADGFTRLPLVARELAGPLQVCLLLVRATRFAITDALTGLHNRRSATDTLQREIEFARRHGLSVAAVLVDLDPFKKINDLHGHASGDRALVAAAAAINDAVRGSDFAARWGGEEFLVIVRNATAAGAITAAERVRTGIAAAIVTNDEGAIISLTASCGVATLSELDTLNELVARADRGLYAAKANGRNRVERGAVELATAATIIDATARVEVDMRDRVTLPARA
ncbi:hypothetical protein BH09MYX1_BH09MYX1_16010 [soil metagenome]